MAAIGVLTLEIKLQAAHSLKDKRHVIQSLQARLRARFNIAISEIDHQDVWQRSTLAAVTVASSREHAAKVLEAVDREAAEMLGSELAHTEVEWID